MSQARTAPTKSALVYLLLLVGSAIFSIPFLWTLSTALKTHASVFAQPPQIWPHPIAWDNFAKAWTALPFTAFVLNTIMLAVVCTSAQVVTGSLVAYGFARFSFRGSKLLFGVLLSTMMLPGQVSMIPVFLIWRDLRAIDTYWPLIVPAFFGGGAFNIFLLRQFFLTIPRELDEAAMIDGAGYPQIWWKVLMPLSGPALATVAVFSFIGHWDDFMGPLIYLNTPEKYTVAIGLRMFQDSYGTDLEQVMAASVIHILPVVVLFFCAQRYFLKGINLTGMGGR
jgi:ABC-type glycerol-3-phosphate transport system permease component